MSENDRKTKPIAEETLQSLSDTELEARIIRLMEPYLVSVKMQLKSVLQVLDTHQTSVETSIKEINMRIGAISGHQAKQRNQKSGANSPGELPYIVTGDAQFADLVAQKLRNKQLELEKAVTTSGKTS